MSLCLKVEKDPVSGCWDIQIFIFWGHIPLEVIFLWSLSLLTPYLTLVWSHKLMFKIWGRFDHWWLMRYYAIKWFPTYLVGGWVYGMIIIPLRGPSCKLGFARISDKAEIPRWSECGNNHQKVIGDPLELWIRLGTSSAWADILVWAECVRQQSKLRWPLFLVF